MSDQLPGPQGPPGAQAPYGPPGQPGVPGPPPQSPKASRTPRPRWLDPKLIIGVLFVLVSTVAGARIISEADSMIEVWAVKDGVKLSEGSPLRQDDLEAKQVRFGSTDADLYVSASDDIPGKARMTRAVGQHELLPRNAFTTGNDNEARDLSIPVTADNMPSLQEGDRIDIMVVPDGDSGEGGSTSTQPATKVLDNVVVLSTPEGGGGLGGGGGESKIVVRVTADEETLASVAGQVAGGATYLVKYAR